MSQPRFKEPLPLGDEGVPYSKGLMARALIATGLGAERAYQLARRIETDLAERGETVVDLDRVGELAGETLGENEGEQAIRRLRRYRELQQLDLPIILLIGGATGTGKSTVATDVAHRLGITRVTSTDFVRQTMRAFFSDEFMPSIHYSSFEAGPAVAGPEGEAPDDALAGFVDQTRNVLVGVRAALGRALEEGWSMVLEGVHLVPGLLPVRIEGALVVQCVLAIEEETAHAAHFWVRDATSEGVRPVDKYLDRLPEIRLIQDYIVERARKSGVPVVENRNIELAIATVMELVFAGAERMEKVR
jgi:2-phosphoglycerate kinase